MSFKAAPSWSVTITHQVWGSACSPPEGDWNGMDKPYTQGYDAQPCPMRDLLLHGWRS